VRALLIMLQSIWQPSRAVLQINPAEQMQDVVPLLVKALAIVMQFMAEAQTFETHMYPRLHVQVVRLKFPAVFAIPEQLILHPISTLSQT
jgi:hypothetical protein